MKSLLALSAILMLIAPFCFSVAFAQTEPPPPGRAWPADPGSGALSPAVQGTQSIARAFSAGSNTSYVNQAAEQNRDIAIQNVEALLTDDFREYSDVYGGLHTFGGNDIVTNFFSKAYRSLWAWSSEHRTVVLSIFACIVCFCLRRCSRLSELGFCLAIYMVMLGIAFGSDWWIIYYATTLP